MPHSHSVFIVYRCLIIVPSNGDFLRSLAVILSAIRSMFFNLNGFPVSIPYSHLVFTVFRIKLFYQSLETDFAREITHLHHQDLHAQPHLQEGSNNRRRPINIEVNSVTLCGILPNG
ncbi:uncharacterized protein LOC111496366 [Cucurbita maxima]|uniref:Uncharacterized protein LOC111496366 n=1 Tax=Cucurbita maxima TaxID=3661 RepID=A0A6J1KP99_CUCMA|nr:uncharacterized protein LOC111496366 [Cucurbita maxima]XP_023002556.1 uncharacterized protein LOC111496366 [Cucurbita maxima]